MKFNLEERLINFSVLILDLVEQLPELKGSNHLAGQLVRSGTAPALFMEKLNPQNHEGTLSIK